MSQAMAQMCAVVATVMDRDPDNPTKDGIWWNTEFKQLRENTGDKKIDYITGILPDESKTWRYWTADSSSKRGLGDSAGNASPAVLEARGGSCGVDHKVAGNFDVGGKYPVQW